jgi:hypothetical protein
MPHPLSLLVHLLLFLPLALPFSSPSPQSLVTLLSPSSTSDRGSSLSPASVASARAEIAILSESQPTPPPTDADIAGRWSLLATLSPPSESDINTVPFWSIDSWRNYLTSKGPSPVQGLLSSSRVSNVAQILVPGSAGRFDK